MRAAPTMAALSLAAAALAAGACAGDGGGASAAGTGAGGSGGSEGAASICYRTCEALSALGCDGLSLEECVAECVSLYTVDPACAPELTAYQDCQRTERADCGADPPACVEAYRGWEKCVTGCAGATCTGSPDSCACEAECNDQPTRVECASAPEGGAACTCIAAGAEVGACEQAGLSCFPSESCCAPLLGL